MSKEIDEQIVSMKFDGTQFGSGVQSALGFLDKLKSSLKLDGTAKGLTDVATAAKNINLDGMSAGVDTAKSKFDALGVMATASLMRIANQAITTGSQVIKSLTLDPVMQGFREYETQMTAVQTILANTSVAGTSLDQVNSALDQLNEYSDKTIYNFSEMAKNVGTFTAAGVGLDASVASIKGIANLAALSGSNSQQAAGAMYQLSQAIASGRVSLMDWNSVVTAGMGGTIFQRALAQTAVAMGKLDESSVTLSGDMKNVQIAGQSFRDSISSAGGQETWLTSDVLTSTLQQFTGDLSDAELAAQGFSAAQIEAIKAQAQQANDAAATVKTLTQLYGSLQEAAGSGWALTWRILVGDFEEAKVLFTDINNVLTGVLGASAKARNDLLQGWKDLGGRTALIEGLTNVFHGLMSVLTPISQAFRDVFPPATAERLMQLTTMFRDFTTHLKMGEQQSENFRRAMTGIFTVISGGLKIVGLLTKVLLTGISLVFTVLSPVLSILVAVLAVVGDILVAIDDFLTKLTEAFLGGSDSVRQFMDEFALGPITEQLDKFSTSLDAWSNKVRDAFSGPNLRTNLATFGALVGGTMSDAAARVEKSDLWAALVDYASTIPGQIDSAMSYLSSPAFFASLGGFVGTFATIGKNAVQAFKDSGLDEALSEFVRSIPDRLRLARDSVQKVDFKGGFTKAATAVSDGAATVVDKLRTTFSPAKIAGVLTEFVNNITEFLSNPALLNGVINFFARIPEAISNLMTTIGKTNLGMAFKQLFDSFAAIDLSGLGPLVKQLGESVAKMFGTIGDAVWNFLDTVFDGVGSRLESAIDSVRDGIANMGDKISGAFQALKSKLASLFDGLGIKDLVAGIALALGGDLALSISNFFRSIKLGDGGLIQKIFGVDFSKIGKGVVDTLNSTSGALQAMQTNLKVDSLLKIAGAMAILAGAIFVLSTIEPDKLGKALGALSIMFAELFATFALFEKFGGGNGFSVVNMGIALVVLSVAVLILTAAMKNLEGLSWGELIKGLTGLTVIIGSLIATSKLLSANSSGLIKGSIGLVIFTAAVNIMAEVLKKIGDMDTGALIQGAIGLGVVVGYLIATAYVLSSNSSGLIKGSVGLMLFMGALKLMIMLVEELGNFDIGVLKQGLLSMGILIAMIAAFLVMVSSSTFGPGDAVAILIFAGAIKILVSATETLGSLDIATLVKGLVALGAIMAGITIMANRMAADGKNFLLAAVGMILMSTAISKIGTAISEMGALDIGTIAKGLVGLGGAMAILAIAARLFSSKESANILAVSVAMTILSVALQNMGSMSVEEIAKALVTLAGSLLVMAVAIKVMSGSAAGVAGLIGMAIAINILAPALILLGGMDLQTILIALVAMAGAFAVLAVAGYAIAPIVPALLGLAGAVALLGAAMALAGLGVFLFATGFATMAAAVVAGGAALAFGLQQIISLIPFAAKQLALGLIAFITTIMENMPLVVDAMVQFMLGILEAINTTAPQIVQTLINLIWLMVNTLVVNVPGLVDAGLQLLLGILRGIRDNIQDIVTVATEIITNFINGISAGLPGIIDAGINLIVAFVQGLADGIRNNSEAMRSAGLDLANAIVDGMIGGLSAGIGRVVAAAQNLASNIKGAIANVLDIKSPSRVMYQLGVWTGEGLAMGIDSTGGMVAKSATRTGEGVMAAMRKTMADLSDTLATEVDTDITIRPVMDLSQLRNQAAQAADLFDFSATSSLAMSAGYSSGTGDTDSLGGSSNKESSGTNLSFTQINNSPKALSRTEIYRQTRNQLSQAKGVLALS